MPKIKPHINFLKHITLLWLVLFSLAPCTVREYLGTKINATFPAPLNKTKTTIPSGGCQTLLEVAGTEFNSSENNLVKEDNYAFKKAGRYSSRNAYVKDYPEIHSANSPPKYILYKRLKINAA